MDRQKDRKQHKSQSADSPGGDGDVMGGGGDCYCGGVVSNEKGWDHFNGTPYHQSPSRYTMHARPRNPSLRLQAP